MKIPILLIFLTLSPVSAIATPHDVFGLWLSEANDGHIEISDCGDGTPCGTLIWVEPDKKADTVLDERNKNKDLRGRPLVGVPIIWGFERSKKGWKAGKIYNPEDGKTFGSRIKRKGAYHLKVKGCLGLVCITNTWTRIEPETQLAKQ